MQTNVIITRTDDENLILAQKIKVLGGKPICAPMLSHKVVVSDFVQFQNYTDIIVTSKFAARIISKAYPVTVDAWVVGEESGELLDCNRNINVRACYDSVLECIEALQNTQNKFLYLSGDHISHEIFFADRQVIYHTEYAKILSWGVLETIRTKSAHFIMFYSKNSAVNFIDLVKRYKLLQSLRNSAVIAISKEVAAILTSYVKEVFYPAKPTAHEMLELLCAKSYEKRI